MDEALLRTRHHLHHIRTSRSPGDLRKNTGAHEQRKCIAMSVSIRPNHTKIGVPQWRHTPAHETFGQPIPDMSGLTLSDGTDYDLNLPDSVWLTIYEDLGEHFARKAAAQTDVHALPIKVPEKGDEIRAEWRKGCGVRRGDTVYGVDCTHHVGIWHVAANTTRALEVWS